MPRNSSGDYSLPAGNPVVTGTAISSTWANNTLDDLADGMTDSLSRSGDGGMLAALALDSGTVSDPGLAFGAESSLGLYRVGAAKLGVAVGGAKIAEFNASGLDLPLALNVVGALGVDGNFDVATDKFTVAAATGNTVVAGTLGVTGAATLSSTLAVTGLATLTAGFTSAAACTIDAATVASLTMQGAAARLIMIEDDQAADNQKFRLDLNSKIITLEFVSDDSSTTANVLSSARGTGVAVSTITVGNTTDNPTINIRGDIVEFNDGSESAPVICNNGDENTGIYWPSADELGFSLGGTGYLVGFRNLPQRILNTSGSLVLADVGKHVYKASGGSGETITVPANASVAFPTGSAIVIVNDGGGTLTINDDGTSALILAGSGPAVDGVSLADHGMATLLKVDTNTWFVSGTGLTAL